MSRRFMFPLIAALALVLTALGVTAPAAAAVKTTTTFSSTDVSAPFGSPWQLAVTVTVSNSFGTAPVQPSDGAVDILIDGMAGEYVTAATIVPGGTAYFVQPANEPPLAAGTYKVTARFTPAAGSGLSESTTKKAATLTIAALTAVPAVEVISDPAVTAVPTVRTTLGGTYVETTGAPPSGTWTVTAVDSSGAEAFAGTAEQPTQGADGAPVGALDIPIDAPLKASETYTVTTVFTPDELIAGGLTIENSAPATFTTRAATAGEVLTAPTGVPVFVSVLMALLIAGLAALLVWLIVQWRRSGVRVVYADVPAENDATAVLPATLTRAPIAQGPPVLEPENPYLPDLPSYPLSPPPVIPVAPIHPVAPTQPPVSSPPAPAPEEPTSWSLSDLGLGDDDDEPGAK